MDFSCEHGKHQPQLKEPINIHYGNVEVALKVD